MDGYDENKNMFEEGPKNLDNWVWFFVALAGIVFMAWLMAK
jgi:hypothetical protein